jgi:hypothetical protein
VVIVIVAEIEIHFFRSTRDIRRGLSQVGACRKIKKIWNLNTANPSSWMLLLMLDADRLLQKGGIINRFWSKNGVVY